MKFFAHAVKLMSDSHYENVQVLIPVHVQVFIDINVQVLIGEFPVIIIITLSKKATSFGDFPSRTLSNCPITNFTHVLYASLKRVSLTSSRSTPVKDLL